MTRLMLFFKKTFMQNIYKLLSLYISSFSSDIHDVETSFFFTQKINTDIWPILVTLCFGGKKNTITSLGNMGMYHYTVGKNGQFFRHCDSNPQPIGVTKRSRVRKLTEATFLVSKSQIFPTVYCTRKYYMHSYIWKVLRWAAKNGTNF